jgi:hypothetical protein
MIRIGITAVCFLYLAGGILAQFPGQNNLCENADPFCTGSVYNFPAGVNAGSGQPGPNYNCLLTTPNPAWYYMKVLNSGNIIIYMHSEPQEDIDFCCWGPFTSQNCCNQLTGAMVVDCSYSPSWQETCVIPNGLTGQYYMLIITNFSNNPCNIIFSQTGGTGTTDCTILPPPATNNSPICTGQTLQLSAAPVAGATYSWWGPANFTSNLQNPSIPNATPVNSGDYFLTILVNGQPSADTSVTTAYIYAPVANAGNDTAIQNGVYTFLHGSCTGGSGSYNYHWEPANKLLDPNVQDPQTVNLFATTIFTLSVTDDSASCQSTDMVTIEVTGGALAVNAVAIPSAICLGATSQLQALGSGGTGSYTYEWSGPGGFYSTLQNPMVQPQVTTVYTVTVNDGYNTTSSEVTVTVIPLPVADAGAGKSIPFGTYTWLSGSVAGGTSSYFYSWSPPDKLVNANVQNPQTVNLTGTTLYSLTVTDLVTNCISDNPAMVTIEVTGGPLTANPSATPSWICKGDSAQLHALAGGGNVGFYEYSWISDPPGFTSSDPDPYVNPEQNTLYTVTVDDGYNTASGDVEVGIHPQPVIHLGPPDTAVCIYDTVTLDAGNPGSTYLWSNGATTRTICVQTTGIGYDIQTYSVEVTNEQNCTSVAGITVIYSFAACTGIDLPGWPAGLKIYPNPASDVLNVDRTGIREAFRIRILDICGKEMAGFLFGEQPIGKPLEKLTFALPGKGLYLIRVEIGDNVFTQKLIIR